MGFFRLLKGELNKILMRPILYVITGVVIFAIIFSCFQFSPASRTSYADYYSQYSELDSLVKVKKMFNESSSVNKYSAVAAEQLITQAEEKLEAAYKRGEKETIINDKGQEVEGENKIIAYLYRALGEYKKNVISEPDNFLSAYLNYMNDQNFRGASVDALIDALANVVGPIVKSSSGTVISPTPAHENNNLASIHYYITQINEIQSLKKKQTENTDLLIPTSKLEKFNAAYIKIYNTVISEGRSSEYDITNYENHDSIRALFKEVELYNVLKDLISSIKVKVISEKTYKERKQNIADAKAYLASYKDEINEFVLSEDDKQVSKLKDMCVKYYLYASNVNDLIENTVLYDAALNLSDKEVTSFYGYNKMQMKDGEESPLYLYAVQEEITKELFLLNNHKTEMDYANVFNGSQTSNVAANAFDLVYFGLEITSIVIIVFTVVLAAGMLAGEQSTGTLKLLLIRPYSRSSILTSKLVATIIFATIFFIFSTILLFLTGWALYGVDFTPVLAVFNATSAFVISPGALLFIYILCLLIKTIFYIAISLAISAIFRSNVGAVSISIVLYFVISIMGTIFASSFIYGFIPFSNLDLFKFFGGSFVSSGSGSLLSTIFSSSIFHGVGFTYSIIMNLVLIAIIIVSSYFIFNKREFK